MEILRADRNEGKTTELVKRASKEWLYIICKDQQRADVIQKVAEHLELEIPYPIMARELPLRSVHIKSVLVDDIEDVLEILIRKKIDIATTSCVINNI